MFSKNFITKIELDRQKIGDNSVYPFSLPIVQILDTINFDSSVTFFVGENGTGKSTLLEAIAIKYGFNPEGGSKNFNFFTRESHSDLSGYIRLSKGIHQAKDGYFFRAETFYNLASEIDDLDRESGLLDSYGGISLHQQSHGESFFSLFINRFFGHGIYILDEPESALSPQRQLAFLIRMKELIDQGSQFIIATHSPIILAYPGSTIFDFSTEALEVVPYDKTNTYSIYELFINNPKYMLEKLGIL